MNRREFVLSGLALGCVPLSGAQAEETGKAGGTRAIAEGGPLTPPKDGLIEVAIAISQRTTWIDFVGPMAVFETWHVDPIQKKYMPRFHMFLVSDKREAVDKLVPDFTFADAPKAHILLVPAQRGSDALLEWLRKASPEADVTMSVCTGAVHLARAGLLNGLHATTHHDSISQFAKQHPEVKWVPGMRYVEGKKISTGGGLTAGIDLALRVTERYFGRPATQQVADHLEYEGKGWIV